MELKKISDIAKKLYKDIDENGASAIRNLYSRGKELKQEFKFDPYEEYVKKMLIMQFHVDRLLLTHKYFDESFDAIPDFRAESKSLREKLQESVIRFENSELEALFDNSLEITSDDEYEEWDKFVYEDSHNGKKLQDIYFEEEFKASYANETNLFKKFFKSFRYRKLAKNNHLDDYYIATVRRMIRKTISDNPENTFLAYVKTRKLLERGIEEYSDLKDLEDIARMTLLSLTEYGTEIDIEESCKTFRSEMRNIYGTTKNGTEYRKKEVTIGSKTGINKNPVLQTIPFEEVPEAVRKLQTEYENAYKEDISKEEFIRRITKIYAEFMYIQPYEDGNKRTAACLFNRMLLSKGIVPPEISLINDERMAEAFYKVKENDYNDLQNIVLETLKKSEQSSNKSNKQRNNETDIDIGK